MGPQESRDRRPTRHGRSRELRLTQRTWYRLSAVHLRPEPFDAPFFLLSFLHAASLVIALLVLNFPPDTNDARPVHEQAIPALSLSVSAKTCRLLDPYDT